MIWWNVPSNRNKEYFDVEIDTDLDLDIHHVEQSWIVASASLLQVTLAFLPLSEKEEN